MKCKRCGLKFFTTPYAITVGRECPVCELNQDIIDKMKNDFPEHQLDYFQSNHEGVLIDKLHEAWDNYDGVVFNPGAYCHTSIALADAIRSIETPVVEVHISDIYSREEYRHHSYTAEASVKSIVGKGLNGYEEAVLYLIGTKN